MTDQSAYSLEFWVGQEVFAVIPAWSRELIPVTICGVEAGGVWIEAEGLTIGFCRGKAERDELDDIGRASAFVPYAQIGYIIFVMPKEARRAGGADRDLPQAEATLQAAERRHRERLRWAAHAGTSALPGLAEARTNLAAARSELERARKVSTFADEVGERARLEEQERTI